MKYLIEKETLNNIARSVQAINGTSTKFTPSNIKTQLLNNANTIDEINTILVTKGYDRITKLSEIKDRIQYNVPVSPTGSLTITENGENIDVTSYAAVNVRVPQGGEGLPTYMSFDCGSVANSSSTSLQSLNPAVIFTVPETGTYIIKWVAAGRTGSSYSIYSQLYTGNTTLGNQVTTSGNIALCQTGPHLLQQGTVLELRGRGYSSGGGSSRYGGFGMLMLFKQ